MIKKEKVKEFKDKLFDEGKEMLEEILRKGRWDDIDDFVFEYYDWYDDIEENKYVENMYVMEVENK